MLPIRDHNPSLRKPWVTYGLIIVNIGVFLSYWPFFDGQISINRFYMAWAMTPERVSNGLQPYTLLTSMFLHGGWMHLLGNMLFLWIFGDNLEDELGHVGFLGFYLVAGLLAGAAHLFSDPNSAIPTVGASGAIAGVMGGYLLMYPRAKVDVFFFFVIFFRIIPLPAWLMLGGWFLLQLFNGVSVDAANGGVAYWAHAGGFVVGFLMMLPVFLRRGGIGFWRKTHGHAPHPEAKYKLSPSSIPKVGRK